MMLEIKLPNGEISHFPQGTTLGEIAATFKTENSGVIVEGTFDGMGKDLQYPLKHSGRVDFITFDCEAGMRVYIRTLLFALIVAIKEVRPEVEIEVKNPIGSSLFCDIINDIVLSKYDLADIEAYMQKMIADEEPILFMQYPKYVVDQSIHDKQQLELLSVLPRETMINVYKLKDEYGYFFGAMLPNLGYLKAFELLNYNGGILLRYPEIGDVQHLEPFKDQPKLAMIFDEAEKWGGLIGCGTVSKLNQFIKTGNDREIIQIAEALHEKKIAQIADFITSKGSQIKLVLIAGPSSSGKTTFAQRLSIQLKVNGYKPMALSLDNYYKERLETPKKPNGEYDYESLEALEIELFNNHLTRILAGEKVEIPYYRFSTGKKEYRGQEIQLEENSVLVVEGIHGLNEKLSAAIARDKKVKIYISALTPMSFDQYNRISTTDMRLLRRMVRDSQFRAKEAIVTLKSWADVREGEEKYIFPFQEESDIMFNTTLIYEFAVLKKYAEPLLASVPATEPEYTNAQRLLKMMSLVLPIDEKAIPNNSIMREFLGNSIFSEML